MSLKKIIIYILVGCILAVLVFFLSFYIASNRQPKDTPVVTKTYSYDIGEFSTNLGSNRTYFKGSIVIEATDEALSEKLTTKNPEIRDNVISILINKKPEDLLDPEGLSELKNQVVSVISKVVESDKITNIYFTDYIIQ